MDNIKLRDLYLSQSELDDIVQLVANKRHKKNYQNKSKDYIKSSRNNQKIEKE